MEKEKRKKEVAVWMLKALLASYVLTIVLLLILAVMLYKLDLNEQKVTIGIISTYVLSTFAGGVFMGKWIGNRRFVWGLVLGVAYFLFLLLISFLVNHNLQSNGVNLLTSMLLCACGGMIGGMVS